jgi:NADH:ubiquinone oxidoreductase subunit 6 (subunit J)
LAGADPAAIRFLTVVVKEKDQNGSGAARLITSTTFRSLVREWWLYMALLGLVLAAAIVGAELTWPWLFR